jgi:hypothetical protein
MLYYKNCGVSMQSNIRNLKITRNFECDNILITLQEKSIETSPYTL